MGNSSSLLQVREKPNRPFQQPNRKSCLKGCTIRIPKKHSTLQKLILLQDWQRVLIRANLYPSEFSHYLTLQVENLSGKKVQLRVLPLHLACALDPPPTVVNVMLHIFSDAVALPIMSDSTIPWIKSKKAMWKQKLREIHRKRRDRNGAFPISDATEEAKKEEQKMLLPKVVAEQARRKATKRELREEESHGSYHESSVSSTCSWKRNKGTALQLASSNDEQLVVVKPSDTDSTSDSSHSSRTVFRVRWDLAPLCDFILDQGGLLPLHLACLYRSSQPVVQSLLEVYPPAAQAPILGMLPVHWVAAGWFLPELKPPPFSLLPCPPKTGPLAILETLANAAPETLRVQSSSHGMTPTDFVEECMEDNIYKDSCMCALSEYPADESVLSPASFVFADDTDDEVNEILDDCELTSCLNALIADKKWDHVRDLIDDDPSLAKEWLYGVDENDPLVPVIWKRLPIHLACAQGAPEELISILLDAYPEGVGITDPRDGSLPLHMACKNGASLAVLATLVDVYADAATVTDQEGRLPLHIATASALECDKIELFAEHDPLSVSAEDLYGKTPMDYADDATANFLETMHLFRRSDHPDIDE